ncbi:Cytochrome P450 [Lasiodiplodia theobromae]|nr:Cytochrome P450 [Lasiodiplodia theobromae]
MRGNQPTVIVSDAQAARDLFDKMGTHTSSRPEEYLTAEIASNGYNIGFQQSGPRWRQGRKLYHSILNVGATRRYLPYQELETTKLVYDILQNPASWRHHVFRYSNSIGLLLTTGRRVPNADDPNIQEIRDNFHEFAMIQINGGLLDYFPLLRKLPDWLFPSARHARQHCVKDAKIALKHYLPAKDSSNPRSILPSFNKALAEKQEKEGFPDIQGARWGLDLLTAATDTTSNTLVNLFAVMALFPKVQRKAHEELDRAIGPDRIPTHADSTSLPYIRQVVQELHRWSSVTPFCLPHATTRDLTYASYTIPAKTTLIINAWHMHNDPAVYPSPRDFKPERWEGRLNANHSLDEESVGARNELFVFGAGRRICPGQHLAEKNLFLTVSKILWACEISQKKDKRGVDVPIDAEKFAPGGVISLAEYAVDIKPRSEGRNAVIKAEWEAGRGQFLDEEEQWKKVPEGVEELMVKVKH